MLERSGVRGFEKSVSWREFDMGLTRACKGGYHYGARSLKVDVDMYCYPYQQEDEIRPSRRGPDLPIRHAKKPASRLLSSMSHAKRLPNNSMLT